MKIFESHYMIVEEQYKFPRYHKKSWRVVKKFQKLYTRMVPSKKALLTRDGILCHPEFRVHLERAIAKKWHDDMMNDAWRVLAEMPSITCCTASDELTMEKVKEAARLLDNKSFRCMECGFVPPINSFNYIVDICSS